MTEAMKRAKAGALAALRPPARLPLSEWIEGNCHLPEGVSALPGAVRLWPFQREIADALGDPTIERVTLVKPVRVGFTTLLTGALASYVANDPAPILALLPTEADARDYMVSDVEPTFAASPTLSGMLDKDAVEGGRNTLLSRRFPGGSLKVVAARAPRNLRRHNVRVLLVDEADAMEPTAEGDPIKLAERRTLSFADRKLVIGSTPIFAETSPVLRSYATSDARVWEVPCPSCGAFSELNWRDIQWPEGKPDEAAWRCPHCEELIPEREKAEMVAGGAWRATRPDVKGHAGFRLNALTSLMANASWGKIAEEFLTAKSDPAALQVWTNTLMGEGWRTAGEAVDETALAARAEPFGLDRMPAEILIVTAGVDVQHDRLEVTFVGWARDGTAFILGHSVVWGAWDDNLAWAELDEVLQTRWEHPLGGQIGVEATVIDAGDGTTMARVQAFCAARARCKVLAGKGMAGARQWLGPSKGKSSGGRLWIVGVDGIKGAVFDRLSRGNSIRFSDDLEPVFFEQLASEKLVVRYTRGQPQRRFERIPGRRAETLDCVVYAFAARQVVSPNWDTRAAALSTSFFKSTARPNWNIRSKWIAN